MSTYNGVGFIPSTC